MDDKNYSAYNESNISTPKLQNFSPSIVNDYLIPSRLIYANSLIKSLKDKKYTWANDGLKVKFLFFYFRFYPNHQEIYLRNKKQL